MTNVIPELPKEIERRRTFAIISHPDAGKTTLTEKLLLYGGAIRLAGAVKAKGSSRHATSDWMEIEKQRGISISTSVMRFEYDGIQVNLLDTPGHKDFSEDTYRTLAAADSAVMLIDAAKGVEPQTRKLFEVCRMRGIPIFTFINKLDRPGRDPFDLIDELEKVLGIRSCPMNWPIGMGDQFKGIYDRQSSEVLLFQKSEEANAKGRRAPMKVSGVDDPQMLALMGETAEEFRAQLELVDIAGDTFNLERVLAGQLSPVFFGSAMNNFGVERFLERFLKIAPKPGPRNAKDGPVPPDDPRFSGFIFKIQANMDPLHRDRVAFLRVCSGKFTRGMNTRHGRLNKEVRILRPLHFFAQEREIIETAWPGDILGILDTSGELLIGDTLAEGYRLEYEGVPRFSPEHFASVSVLDPMKRKQMKTGLDQLSEEGVIQIFRQPHVGDKAPVAGAVGVLQFEILTHRMKAEYGVDIRIERMPYQHCRWFEGTEDDKKFFEAGADTALLEDLDQRPVVLFKSTWSLEWAENNRKTAKLHKTPVLKRG